MGRRAVLAGALSVSIAIAASSGARGQSLGDAIQGAMNRTSGILQHSAGTQSSSGQSGSAQPATGQKPGPKASTIEQNRPAPPARTILPVDRNSFARISSSSHRLPGGVVLQTTGDFMPDAKAACSAPCK